jgi:glycerophosphoryl diester phosphodiesterase
LICAHRGASATLPDNSLQAFEAAIESGCELIETDLRRGPDGGIVLAHDSADARHEDVVNVEALLALARGRIRLDLELKEPGLERDVLDTIEGDRGVIISSFSANVLREVRALDPCVQTGLIVEPPLDAQPLGLADRAGADALIINDSLLTRQLLEDAASRRRSIWVWTINDEPRLAELLAEPLVFAVITDVPAQAVAIRASLEAQRERVS